MSCRWWGQGGFRNLGVRFLKGGLPKSYFADHCPVSLLCVTCVTTLLLLLHRLRLLCLHLLRVSRRSSLHLFEYLFIIKGSTKVRPNDCFQNHALGTDSTP